MTPVEIAAAARAAWDFARRFWWAIPIAALTIALFTTRATLATRTATLAAEKSARKEEVANVRAATEKARADDLGHARAVEAQQAKNSQEIQDDLTKRLAAARADADAYARRLRAGAAGANSGGGGATHLPGAADATGAAHGAGQGAEMDDARACAEAVVKAQGWQDWWRGVGAAALGPNVSPPK